MIGTLRKRYSRKEILYSYMTENSQSSQEKFKTHYLGPYIIKHVYNGGTV